MNEAWLASTDLLILEEIHKMPKWKNYLKGIYDTKQKNLHILVTGSARLEVFRSVGDSLAGRYFLHRLLPLSLAECFQLNENFSIDHFLERGGFPEPFLSSTLVDANRWRMQYVDSLLREDVLEFDNIQNLKSIPLVFELLRERVGSTVSFSSIARDAELSSNTVKKYIQILEALYIVFRVTPYSRNIGRSLLKEPKIYFFDSGLVKGDHGAQLENLVAVSLLKHVYGKIDYSAEDYSLNYLQTKEKKEVDFVLVKEQVVQQLIEVKYKESIVSPHLRYFHEKYQFPACQIVKDLKNERVDHSISVVKAENFLKGLAATLNLYKSTV